MNRNHEKTATNSASGISGLDQADRGGELRRLDRLAALGVLSASVAHEIKNALVPVKTFVDLLLEQNPESELATIVRRELDRINLLVAQMLKLARPGTSTHGRVSLHQVIDDSLRLIQNHAETKGIAIERSYFSNSDTVIGDRNQLEQVFLNLLFNAIEAMHEHGRLSVKTEQDLSQEPGCVRIIVSDTGVGIAPNDLQLLFVPFFSTKQEGTGLGLVIAKEIVTEHKGTISVQSSQGQGTSFTVVLPLAGSAAAAQ